VAAETVLQAQVLVVAIAMVLHLLVDVTEKARRRLEDEIEKVAHLLVDVIETVRLHSVVDVTVLPRLVATEKAARRLDVIETVPPLLDVSEMVPLRSTVTKCSEVNVQALLEVS
jgi:hypothetical protein